MIKSKIYLAFFMGLVALVLVSSCSKDVNEQYLKVSDFDNIGLLHNEFLSASDISFPDGLNPNEPTYVETLNNFNKTFIQQTYLQQTYGFTSDQSVQFQTALEAMKSYLVKANLVNELNVQNSKGISWKFQTLTQNQIFSNFGGNLLQKFLSDIKSNLDGNLSNEQLQIKVNGYIELYDNNHYLVTSGEGKVIGTILAISKHSLLWWLNPSNALKSQLEPRIAPWLAADLLGAACGAGSSILQDVFNGDDVDWSNAAAWGIGGAVCGSVGIRIGRR
jgi:hypothetical protein